MLVVILRKRSIPQMCALDGLKLKPSKIKRGSGSSRLSRRSLPDFHFLFWGWIQTTEVSSLTSTCFGAVSKIKSLLHDPEVVEKMIIVLSNKKIILWFEGLLDISGMLHPKSSLC